MHHSDSERPEAAIFFNSVERALPSTVLIHTGLSNSSHVGLLWSSADRCVSHRGYLKVT